MRINILDCTLRDGGYINNWDFKFKNIKNIINSLEKSGIEIIECGYLSDKSSGSIDSTFFNSINSISNTFLEKKKKNIIYAAMIDFGGFNIENLSNCDENSIDMIRLAFHKKDMKEALVYASKVFEKGYKVSIQPMVTISYSDYELLELVKICNNQEIYSFYIADSFGEMRMNDVTRLSYLLDNNLKKHIYLGFHSHNNLQLSYANSIEFLKIQSKRNLIIDSSILGMGRGAGNLNTELFAEYLNLFYDKNYNLYNLLDVIDTTIDRIYKENYWGYSVAYYLSAINGCHPNYASFYFNKNTLPVKDINSILKTIAPERKLNYDKKYAEEAYFNYNEYAIDDENNLEQLKSMIGEKEVLLLAFGKSINTEKNSIVEHLNNPNKFSIWINNYDHDMRTDMVFINNAKRYKTVQNNDIHAKFLITSNVKKAQNDNEYIVDYAKWTVNEIEISDNALLMLLNICKVIGIKKAELAGFDGYTTDNQSNYYDTELTFEFSKKDVIFRNELIKKHLKKYSDYMTISFVTKSLYQ